MHNLFLTNTFLAIVAALVITTAPTISTAVNNLISRHTPQERQADLKDIMSVLGAFTLAGLATVAKAGQVDIGTPKGLPGKDL